MSSLSHSFPRCTETTSPYLGPKLTPVFTKTEPYEGAPVLERVEITPEMAHWTLAVMIASVTDSPQAIRFSSVLGFIVIADVDQERRRVKFLSPVSGRLGNHPLIWGRWPEPYLNLLA